MLEYPYIEDWS